MPSITYSAVVIFLQRGIQEFAPVVYIGLGSGGLGLVEEKLCAILRIILLAIVHDDGAAGMTSKQIAEMLSRAKDANLL